MSVKFYKCNHCGNIVAMVKDSGVNVVCCGEKMQELIPGAVDAAFEKHVPVVEVNADTITVKVGSAPHPMTPEHYIEFIAIETTQGVQIKYLDSDFEAAEYKFGLADGDHAVCSYAYCNLHGLWSAKIQKKISFCLKVKI